MNMMLRALFVIFLSHVRFAVALNQQAQTVPTTMATSIPSI